MADRGTMLKLWCTLMLIVGALGAAPAAPASTKREDGNGGNNGGGNNNGGQPVYSPSASSNSYSSAAYEGAESGSSYKSQPPSQGNLYYYYYPVQEKAQDNAYASSSTHNYATAPANSGPYDQGGDGSAGGYHAAQSSDAFVSQDGTYAGALNQLSQYGLANGYSLGGGGMSSGGLASALGASSLSPAAFSAYGAAGLSPAGYAAIPAGYGAQANGAIGSYPAGSAAIANYAPQGSSLAQYAAQLTGYGQQGYGQQGYGVAQGYGTPSRRYGLGSLIMPMLALAGLTMLIPTVTSSLGSRNKRSTDPQKSPLHMISEYKDKLERYYSLYRTAVEKEECMNRIICEFGNAVSDVKGKGAVVLVLDKLLPKHMRPKMNVFKTGALSSEIGKCKKMFKC